MTAILTLLAAVICYAIKESLQPWRHEYSIFSKSDKFGFFGHHSWVRKYERIHDSFIAPPENLYYSIFKIEYKEKFPFSATALVFLTDGFHFFQFMFMNLLVLSFALLLGDVVTTFIWLRIAVWIVWGMCFELILKK